MEESLTLVIISILSLAFLSMDAILKEDLKKGRISKYYFDIRAEQVKLLDNIKDIPAMFIHEEAKYKNSLDFLRV